MTNESIIERIIDALKSRGFADAEAKMMIKRIQVGDAIMDPLDENIIKTAYDRGFGDGRYSAFKAQAEQYQNALDQARRQYAVGMAQARQFTGWGFTK